VGLRICSFHGKRVIQMSDKYEKIACQLAEIVGERDFQIRKLQKRLSVSAVFGERMGVAALNYTKMVEGGLCFVEYTNSEMLSTAFGPFDNVEDADAWILERQEGGLTGNFTIDRLTFPDNLDWPSKEEVLEAAPGFTVVATMSGMPDDDELSEDDLEPSDDDIYNRSFSEHTGVEGGIYYDTTMDEPGSLGENDWRL
jgi:hypothetical protein